MPAIVKPKPEPKQLDKFPEPVNGSAKVAVKPGAAAVKPAATSAKKVTQSSKSKGPEQVSAVTTAPREMKYPELRVNGILIPQEKCVITGEIMREILGWEAEKDYTTRMLAANEKLKPESAMYGDDYVLKDEEGQKIRCWNNCRNRPFDESHSRKLAQDILNRNWAGPITMEGETVNGETIIIGRTGQVESGQHRGIGLMLAIQIWKKHPLKWSDKWPTEPVLESLIVTGVSESASVLRTLDNVKPRTIDDVFYTSDLFQKLPPQAKKECSRMLGRAVTFLWQRTIEKSRDKPAPYQTHSESISWVDRHKNILKCLKHLFEENKDRVISNLRLSAGQCAGIMYLMGCSSSDGDIYRMEEPNEKKLDWENWDKAMEFWVMVGKDAASNGTPPGPITKALGSLVDPDGKTGRTVEKVSILAKAWQKFVAGEEFTEADLTLEYGEKDGQKILAEFPDFGGIDLGPSRQVEGEEAAETTPEPEELSAEKAKLRKERAEQIAKTIEDRRKAEAARKAKGEPPAIEKPPTKTLADELRELKQVNGDKLLLFKGQKGYHAWGEDAEAVAKTCRLGVKIVNLLPRAEFPLDKYEVFIPKLLTAGYQIALLEQNGKQVSEVKHSPKPTQGKPTAPVKPPLRGGTSS